jgi:hypothetical protein
MSQQTKIGWRTSLITLAIIFGAPAWIIVSGLIQAANQKPQSTTNQAASAPTAVEPSSTEGRWYVGGTLHNATPEQWRSGTKENRLATCADFIAASKTHLRSDLAKAMANPESPEAKVASIELCAGIDKFMAETDVAGTNSARDVVPSLLVLMGYTKR